MKKSIFLLGAVLSLLLLFGCFGPISLKPSGGSSQVSSGTGDVSSIDNVLNSLENAKYFENQLVVLYEDREAVERLAEKLKGRIVDEIPQLKAVLVETPMDVKEALKLTKSWLAKKEITGIRAIEPNYIRELEPVIKEEVTKTITLEEENLEPYQWALETLHATEVWETATGTGVIVAVLDTGVDGTHPDLQGQLVDGYDPYDGVILPADEDSDTYGHGTHVAGIIAAKRDDAGVTGLAYGAKIMPIRIFEPYYVGDFYVADGIVWAVDNGADVLSNSWGGWGYSQILHEAFNYALENNVVVVVSAGNEKTDQHFTYPAGLPGVIAVGATTVNDKTVSWSSRGDYLSVGAPGVYILSTIPLWLAEDEGINGTPYAYWSGTSMACPYVSALVALIKEKYPDATPYQIRKMIEETAVDIDEPGYDTSSGYGRIDPPAALNLSPEEVGEGGSLSVVVTDRSGRELSGVFVTLKNTETGKTYYGKTDLGYYDEEIDADFNAIEPGTYEVAIGGPDFADHFVDPYSYNYRMEEELQYATTVTIESSATLNVTFKSSFSATINPSKPLPEGANIHLAIEDMYGTTVAEDWGTSDLYVEFPEEAHPGHYWLYFEYEGDLPELETSLEEGFENGEIPAGWTTGGDAEPFVQSYVVFSGSYALQFGDIDDGEESWMEFTVNYDIPVVISFWVKVSSEEDFDYFRFYVDNELWYELSGWVEWTQLTFELTPGEHTIKFAYEKDSSISVGYDTAWIDDIAIWEEFRLVGEVNINGNTIPVYSVITPDSTTGYIDEYGGDFAPWTIF